MRNRYVLLLLSGLAVVLSAGLPVHADDAPTANAATASDKPAEPEGTLLFDGESLKNWKPTDFGREGKVEVKDGMLVIGQGEPLTGITWDGEELPKVDYELRLDAQRVEGGDFFCGLTFPVGKDFCTLVLGGWGGGLTGISSINYQDASENETTNFYEFVSDKWYHVRIRVTKSKIEATLDDVTLADVEYEGKKIGVRFEMESSKPLGIATYRTTGAVRNFRLLRLDEHGEPLK